MLSFKGHVTKQTNVKWAAQGHLRQNVYAIGICSLQVQHHWSCGEQNINHNYYNIIIVKIQKQGVKLIVCEKPDLKPFRSRITELCVPV